MSLAALASLLKQTHIHDDEEVLRAANAALGQAKDDLNAQHVKVVALLKLDRFEDALRALGEGGDSLKERASLEHAYVLYKCGELAAAAALAQNGSQRGLQHVEAQARYRKEEFERAAELYQQLATQPGEDAEADLRINSGAVDAQLEWAGRSHLVQKGRQGRHDLEAFETVYNTACGSIARSELAQGEVLLRRAVDLCSSLDDLSEEEKQAELLPIKVQQIYVLARLGRIEEATELAQSIDYTTILDPITRQIAQINIIAATPATNPYLSHRLLGKDLQCLRPDYPFQFQFAVLRRVQYASDLQALKYDGVAKSTAKKLGREPSTSALSNSLSVVNATAHAKGQTGKEALKRIIPVLEHRPSDIGLLLTITQLYVLTGNPASAMSLMDSFLDRLEQSTSAAEQDARFAPGLVAAAASLLGSQGRKTHARTGLAKAAIYWRRKPKDHHPIGCVHLFKSAASSLLESQDSEHLQLSREIFEELHAADANDQYAAAGLLAASPDKSSPQGISLIKPIEWLISGIDAQMLETAGVAQPPSTNVSTKPSRKRPADENKPRKTKKLRESRLPKDYDPTKKPDPERWLPLRDRSTYRPKGKKAKARQALFSQGAVANEGDGSRPVAPGGDIVKEKQQQGGVKKKKGKAGKW